jgi:hypothetical protein
MKTKDESEKGRRVREHQGRTSVPKDEKIVGYYAPTNHTGGFVGFIQTFRMKIFVLSLSRMASNRAAQSTSPRLSATIATSL